MIVLGIDPGKTGGLALIDDLAFVEGHRMPTLMQQTREVVDTRQLTRLWMDHMNGIDVIVIERVHSMPRQGVASSFSFGRHTGAVEGWALQLGKPLAWVTPAAWKKRMGLSSSKQASLDACSLNFGPNRLWEVKANDGIAEAALIALDWAKQFGKQG
jgi:crossover junction endodeoxyribonuclease RuvC